MKILPLDKCINKYDFKKFFVNSTTSTMDEARNKLNSINNNFIVLAKKQTKGRGRHGNNWISPSGNIYCSIALSINKLKIDLFKFGILSSVIIKKYLEYIGLSNIYFKWPNDIYCNGKKISGILQESCYNNQAKQFIIIGIGINYKSSPNNLKYKTTCINDHVKNLNLNQCIEILINFFLKYLNDFYLNNNLFYFLEYKKFQMFLNTEIKIKINKNKTIYGKFIKINNDGSLMLKKDKEKLSIYSGQIQL